MANSKRDRRQLTLRKKRRRELAAEYAADINGDRAFNLANLVVAQRMFQS